MYFVDEFMRLAIREALRSKERLRCGAVIVRDGRVVSKACNKQRTMKDASAHAEINAIRKAGRKMGNKDLSGCTIYCTCEPCVMCLSAIAFA
jgi:guanine deaminase